jgi:hypothetical protein
MHLAAIKGNIMLIFTKRTMLEGDIKRNFV